MNLLADIFSALFVAFILIIGWDLVGRVAESGSWFNWIGG